ncbi:PfkB-like carbohydrate kinase family protein [Hibiscus syriacus]|uniref:PfkB-like carbohydrate kinase family protein n=1 Tax=Hibiscus syriacus TaxID=106335 RepID=A0A6A3B797_HIBSY|nr:pentatricopeptide repeat-containing protein At5g01110-like [Hibiscus syriacus]KAE8713084.1 PfkB-like carbohydrate kinase family protein [Hibiscus syriacus]
MEMYRLSRKHLNLRLFALSSKSPSSTLQTPILTSHQRHTVSSSYSSTTFAISSSGSSSFSSTPYPSSRFFNRSDFWWFRSFSASSSRVTVSRKQISEITNLIRRGDNDLESKLDAMNVRLSEVSLNAIFQTLTYQKVSALRFFDWIRHSHLAFHHSSDICSLVIDNCGRLGDFDSIFNLLNDFRLHDICLNQKAFGYLRVEISSKAATRNSICKVIEVLNKIGGSCGVSGIHALIEMLCFLGSFEMAEYAIANTKKRLSNYSILIRGRCRIGHFKEARRILDEMIKMGCQLNSQTFNYILSCLCKNDRTDEADQLLELMLERGCPPDALTFEIFICHFCSHGKLDTALEWLDKMESKGIDPRPTTHAAFIKGYFKLKQYEEARQYVAVSSDKYKAASNVIYSLLANLHRKRGEPVTAQIVLSEMIEKGLKPNFSVYMKILKHLQKSGREDLARNLERSFSSFISQPCVGNG